MPPSITNIAKGSVDIIVPCTLPLVETEWDLVDEAVMALDESYASTSGAGGAAQEKLVICEWGVGVFQPSHFLHDIVHIVPAPPYPLSIFQPGDIFQKTRSATARMLLCFHSPRLRSRADAVSYIVTAGLLPPPLTLPPDPLLHSDAYNLHLARLAQLSLHANVYLKALPPVVDITQGNKWWEDRSELEQVLRMYGEQSSHSPSIAILIMMPLQSPRPSKPLGRIASSSAPSRLCLSPSSFARGKKTCPSFNPSATRSGMPCSARSSRNLERTQRP
jgi:hypothetical protein